MLSDTVDAILIINLDEASERWEKIHHSFSELGLEEKLHRISAVRGAELPGFGQPPWFREQTRPRAKKIAGSAGCVLSHAKAIRYALQHPEWETVLILEDDAVPCKTALDDSSELLKSFTQSQNWDIIYLGHTGTSRHSALAAKASEGPSMIVRTDGVLGTFAMLIHSRAWQTISDALPTEKNVWAWLARHKASDYWLRNRFSPLAKTYILTPDPILHADGISSISGESVNSPPEVISRDSLTLSEQELVEMLAAKAPLKRLQITADSIIRFLFCRLRGFSPGKQPPIPPQ